VGLTIVDHIEVQAHGTEMIEPARKLVAAFREARFSSKLIIPKGTGSASAARWDRATPSTHYDLVRARNEAQARTGIPVANRAFLSSAEVDTDLLPIVMCMGRGDEAATAQGLTQDFNERYREFGQRVLAFSLRTYRHSNIDGLKRAVGVA
jgi:hypothetical protein